MSLKERLENAIKKAGVRNIMFVTESRSTNSVYINLMFCDTDIRISDHTKKNMFGEVYDLDIAEEIISASEDLAELLEKEGIENSKIEILKLEFEKISNSINSRRANLEKARLKKQEQSLLAIEQAKEILNSEEIQFLRRKNGLLIIGRELSFYRFLQKKGIKIKKSDAYKLYREAIWSQEQEG